MNYGYNKTASYLNEILEKDSFDVIKNSTIFKYGENLINYQKVQPVGLQNESVDIFPADLNADGYSDLIALTRVRNGNEISYSNFKVLMKTPNSSSNNYTTLQPYNLPSNYIAYVGGGRTSNKNFVNDFNGDGQSDLLFGKTESNQFKEIAIFESTNNGNTFSSPTIILPTIYPQSSAKLENIGPNGNWIISGDFSGDGRTDVITFLTWPSGGGQTQIMLGGTNFFYSPVFNGLVTFGTINWHNAKSVSVVDFNGDGRDDIMLIGENECEIQTYNHGTNSFQRIYFTSYFGYPTKYDLIYQGDFNGDGKTDFLTRGSKTDNNYSWNIGKSTGVNIVTTSFTFDQTPNITNYYNDQILISDYNGDGKSDIAHMWFSGSQTNSKIDIYYSNGNSFYKEQTSYNDRFLSEPGLNFTLDFDADGRSDIFNRNFIGNPTFDILNFNKGGKEHLLHKVKNGIGKVDEFNYQMLTEGGSFYNRTSILSFPFNNIQPSIPMVSEYRSSNGIGSFNILNYQYEALKVHKTGKGFLGFTKIITNNITTGFKTIQENEFSSLYFSPALKKTSNYRISDNSLLSETIFTNSFIGNLSGLKSFWIKTSSIIENNSFEMSFKYSSFTFDDFGNNLTKVVNINDIEEISIVNIIETTLPNVVPYKIESTTTSMKRLTEPSYSFTTDYSYTNTGKLSNEIKFFGLPKQVQTEYGYDPNLGNNTSIIVSATGLANRINTTLFDSKGRFPIEITNTRNQKSFQTFNAKFGNQLTQKDLDDLITSYEYDSWGRIIKTNLPEGYSILNSYGWDINPSEGTVYFNLTTHPGKPDVKIWYDQLGRERKRQIEGHLNEWITIKTTYDAKGNIATTTAPYKASETVLTTTNQYDEFNRITTSSNTLGSTGVVYIYNAAGEQTTTTTA